MHPPLRCPQASYRLGDALKKAVTAKKVKVVKKKAATKAKKPAAKKAD